MKTFPAITLLFVALMSAALAPAREAVPHFKFSAGQTNVYSVAITVRSENGSLMSTGNVLVAAIEVASNGVTLSCRGNLRAENRRAQMRGSGFYPGFGGGMMPGGLLFPNDCQLLLDAQGREIRDGGDYVLDVPLGKLVESFFGPLPSQMGSAQDSAAVLEDPYYLGPADNFLNSHVTGPPYSMGYYYNNGMRSSPAILLVTRQTDWEAKGVHSGSLEFHRQVKLESPAQIGGQPRLKATSESDYAFDPGAGCFSRIDTEAEVSSQTETTVRHAKVSFHARLLVGDELAAALAPPPPPAPPRKLAGAELDKFAADLASGDIETRRAAVRQLNGAEIDSPSAEVMEAVSALAQDSDSFVRMTAANFVCNHATTNQVPTLLRLVRDPDWSVRQPVVKALGRLHDSRAAEPLADILARNGNMYGQDISTALINLGTPAESAVIGVLNERNYETQRLACQILQEIGTSASMDSLQKALADGDSSVSQAASDAIHAIKERM